MFRGGLKKVEKSLKLLRSSRGHSQPKNLGHFIETFECPFLDKYCRGRQREVDKSLVERGKKSREKYEALSSFSQGDEVTKKSRPFHYDCPYLDKFCRWGKEKSFHLE